MSEQNPLFRKAALDKLASPERLDVLMQVTSPKGWLALLTMALLLAGVIVWSIKGSIPERLDGQGMLIRGGALRELRSTAAGVLEEFTLVSGATVAVDQLLGKVRQDAGMAKVRAASDDADRYRMEAQNTEREHRATQAGLKAQISGLEEQITRANDQLARDEDILAQRNASFAKGLVTRMQVTAAENDVESSKGRIAQMNTQIRQANAQISTLEQQIRNARDRYQTAANQASTGVKVIKAESQIKSEFAGRVIELRVKQGDPVQPGQTLAIVEPLDGALQTILYFDSRQARRIKPAMEAQISPSEIKREEFGFIKGKVTAVSEAPVTLQKMQSDLANQALAQELYGKVAVFEVRAELATSAVTPSGFEWSTSEGPPFAIVGNSRINVSVVVDRRKPYTYVLPMLKAALGTS